MVDETRRDILASIGAGAGLAVLAGPANAQSTEEGEDPPFEDPDRPVDERVSDLVGRLETEEKIALLHQYQQPVDRLGVGAFRTGTEALHGASWLNEATVFPQSVGLGSTWDPDLIERVGSAVGDEVRGKHSETNGGVGLNVWSPVVDPLRDPRWGRNEEGYSEDPLLSGEAAAAYTRGLSGDDPDYLKVAPSLKHYLGYNNETDRTTTNAELPPRLLHDYYDEFFRPPIEAGDAVGVMAAYNLVNGRPMTASPLLDSVREWAPDSEQVMNVSDAWAPVNLTGAQEYYDTDAEARAAAIEAGLDSFTEWGSDNSTTVDALTTAVDEGMLAEADLDAAVSHVLSVRFRLGEFEPDSENPYAGITGDAIGAPEHRELAREAARKQTVLLENDDLLPLSEDDDVALVGPLSQSVFTDWYSGTPPYRITAREGVRDRVGAENLSSAKGADTVAFEHVDTGQYVTAGVSAGGGGLQLQATDAPSVQEFDAVQWDDGTYTLRASANERYVSVDGEEIKNDAEYPFGWENVNEAFEFVDVGEDAVALRHPASGRFVANDDGWLSVSTEEEAEAATFRMEVRESGLETAAEAASDADAAVVMVGTHPLIGGRETKDRDDLGLAPDQQALIERVAEANDRVAVVLQTSYPVTMDGAQSDVSSVLWTSHAGQETGRALADVLFGGAPPGGRVPQTWPKSADQLPDIKEYNIAETGTTYLYGQDDPLYPFGYGLSYADFEYGAPEVPTSEKLGEGETATVSVEVTNVGSHVADEVVQLYTSQQQSRTDQPERVLRDFERVRLEPDESRTVELDVAHEAFSFWDVTRNQRVVERATHRVYVGSSAADTRGSGTLQVEGEDIPPRDLGEETRAVDADDWTWDAIELLDKSKSEGTAVGMTEGAWVSFSDVDLRDKPAEAVLSVARGESGSTTIEIRRGGPSGSVLGTAEVPSTGDVYSYEAVTAALEHATGNKQEIYLVAQGSVRVHTAQFQ